jgi:hypothetical protein
MLSRFKDGHPDELPPHHMYRWAIDVTAGTATIANPLGSDPITSSFGSQRRSH